MAYQYDKALIKQQARGRWFDIFKALDPRLTPAVDNAGVHVPCPAGIGGHDSFRFELSSDTDGHAFSNQADNKKLSDGFGVLIWLNGWSFSEALSRVNNYLIGNAGSAPRVTAPIRTDKGQIERKSLALRQMLKHAKQQITESASAYYHKRGLDRAGALISSSLLYHNGISIPYRGQTIKQGNSWVTVPAIIGRMSSSQGWTGAQIIRLTPDGEKADGFMLDAIEQATGTRPDSVKSKQLLKTASSMAGSAVRLGKADSVLCVGEGLETMLAVAVELGTVSVASAGTAALLERLEVPPQVNRLLIFADKDLTGRGALAAEALRDKMKDRMDVQILLPPSPIPDGVKGVDWLDDMEKIKDLQLELFSE